LCVTNASFSLAGILLDNDKTGVGFSANGRPGVEI
jgi:hypothetical protein